MSGRAAVSGFDSSLWQSYGSTPDYVERRDRVCEMLPGDVTSILDVGCGTGDVADHIASRKPGLRVVGVDPSMSALKYPSVRCAQGELPHLPFPAASFDTVLCLQVLEHLEDAAFEAARTELLRVAARYLLIGVPYRETLQSKMIRCADCGARSHADGHVRRFNERDIRNLFTEAVLERSVLTGVLRRREPRLSAALGRIGDPYTQEIFTCPACGSHTPARATGIRRGLQAAVAPARWILTRGQPVLPYWSLALYRKVP